ncbi:flagellar hook assembly protein FlgD [Siculibacillus lacustris]|uniref:Basal-body rod modification protein FlgD n=1 Tax=Siculibacillus lacustris TaxID=1549641 RepID=A0A4V6MZ24_9HYPH|nr:flagellar hook capping FlgD N-terminal domain-containing protein [Siculibacillus lacustris]TBW37391.1 flagellar hook assembly protein FlgD [Siculibacillus lacustris]
MSILGLTTPTLSSSTSTAATDSASLSSNYTMFINLLVTQMKNQDPMNPTDTSTFTSQLVQYSSVEQQIKTNSNLADLKALLTTQNATALVNYVGTKVTAGSATSTWDGTNAATWNFTSSGAATSGTVTIKNSDGTTVYTGTQKLTAGNNTFTWKGTTTAGGTAKSGDYTISVAGTDTSGNALTITTSLTGVVDDIDFSGDTPMLSIGGQEISAYSVTKVASGS